MLERRDLLSAFGHLCYTQHGGSGLHFTLSEVRELDWDTINFYLGWLQEQRRAEAAAMKNARKG